MNSTTCLLGLGFIRNAHQAAQVPSAADLFDVQPAVPTNNFRKAQQDKASHLTHVKIDGYSSLVPPMIIHRYSIETMDMLWRCYGDAMEYLMRKSIKKTTMRKRQSRVEAREKWRKITGLFPYLFSEYAFPCSCRSCRRNRCLPIR